jgi:hypothetical protein
VAWIAGTKVKFIEVVLDKIAYGSSPQEIHFQHPNLSLTKLEESDKLAVRLSDAEFRRKLVALKRPL